MRKPKEIAIALRAIQKAHVDRHMFVVLYEDGSGGLYEGTIKRHVMWYDWASGDEAVQQMGKTVRRLYLTNEVPIALREKSRK